MINPYISSLFGSNYETHVFLVAGQSNMVPRTADNDPVSLSYPEGTLQWGRLGVDDGVVIPATVPLQNVNTNPSDGPGIVTQFCVRYKQDNPNHTILLVPCAEGGTGFINNDWNKGDVRYEDAVSRVNAVFTANPNYIFKGILWHQGESDVVNASYETDLDTFISDIRNDINVANSSTPIVIGELHNTTARNTVNAIIIDTPNRLGNVAVARCSIPTELATYDGTHFTEVASVEFGNRYYEQYITLI